MAQKILRHFYGHFQVKGGGYSFNVQGQGTLRGFIAQCPLHRRVVAMEFRLHKMGQYVRGWMGYFGISEYYTPIPELDEWIRRRIRMCYWKQWRWPRTKIKHLLAMGVSLKAAIQHGTSSKSYWHMARTPAMQLALNNDWLKAQGLPSIKTLWCKAQGYSS